MGGRKRHGCTPAQPSSSLDRIYAFFLRGVASVVAPSIAGVPSLSEGWEDKCRNQLGRVKRSE